MRLRTAVVALPAGPTVQRPQRGHVTPFRLHHGPTEAPIRRYGRKPLKSGIQPFPFTEALNIKFSKNESGELGWPPNGLGKRLAGEAGGGRARGRQKKRF